MRWKLKQFATWAWRHRRTTFRMVLYALLAVVCGMWVKQRLINGLTPDEFMAKTKIRGVRPLSLGFPYSAVYLNLENAKEPYAVFYEKSKECPSGFHKLGIALIEREFNPEYELPYLERSKFYWLFNFGWDKEKGFRILFVPERIKLWHYMVSYSECVPDDLVRSASNILAKPDFKSDDLSKLSLSENQKAMLVYGRREEYDIHAAIRPGIVGYRASFRKIGKTLVLNIEVRVKTKLRLYAVPPHPKPARKAGFIVRLQK